LWSPRVAEAVARVLQASKTHPITYELGGPTFGQYDVLLICEMPDTIRAAALSMAISAGGAVKAAETTALMSFEDGLAALTKAKAADYTPPPGELPYFGLSGVTP
jgi:uncharacterized protein with GYD domain